MAIYPACYTQVALLKAKKAFVIISIKYLDFANIFFEKSAIVLMKYISINNYIIYLKNGK